MRICGQGDHNIDKCFYGSVTVGERGQIVIPAEARSELGLQPGDKLLIVKHPIYEGLIIAKLEAFQGFLNEFSETLEKLKVIEGQH